MKIIREGTEWSRFHIVRKDTGETIDSYTERKDAEDWVKYLVSEGDFTKDALEIVDSHKSETIKYPNGQICRDDSVDMDKALDYQYGTDRDPDNSNYTEEEKQRALDYYIKKTEGDAPGKLKESLEKGSINMVEVIKENSNLKESDSNNEDRYALFFPYTRTSIVSKERAIKALEHELDYLKNNSGSSVAGRGFAIYCIESVDEDGESWVGRDSSKEFLNTLGGN